MLLGGEDRVLDDETLPVGEGDGVDGPATCRLFAGWGSSP